MKSTNILLLTALAYFGYKAMAKKGAADTLEYGISKVNIRFDGLAPVLDLILAIKNPSRETLRVGSIMGEVFLNGNYLAAISGYQMTDIKGLHTTFFPISARLSASGIVTEAVNIVRLISDRGVSALANKIIRFKGDVNAEGITVPLDFTYQVL